MSDLVQNTLEGVMIGSAYALLALGFNLIFGLMRRLNLAFGASIMLAAYVGVALDLQFGIGALAVALTVVLGAAILGAYVELLCFAPMGPKADIAAMISSFAIWMQLEQAAVLLLPRHTYAFPSLVPEETFQFGTIFIRSAHLQMITTALLLLGLSHVVLYRTRWGLGLRAVIGNPVAAHLSGIPVRATMLSAFVLACALGGAAGVLILSADGQVTPMLGMWATFKGLIAMMIGGLGSLPGALVGGFALGIVEVQGQYLWGPQGRDVAAYLLLFLVTVLRSTRSRGSSPVMPMMNVGRG